MTTYKILDHLEETVKVMTVNNIEEVEDAIYDLQERHGFQMVYIIEEIK